MINNSWVVDVIEEKMKTKQNEKKLLKHGWDENNLAEFPLALLGDKAIPGQSTLEFQDEIEDWESGERITRKVCITASEKWGLPTSKDEDVLLALIQLTKLHNGFRSPEVYFTKHEIIRLLGWKNRGWAYDRIGESLNRWKSLSIHYVNAWRDHANRRWRDSEALGVIEYFRLTDGRKSGGSSNKDERSRFIWNSVLFQSFQAGYLKKLDFDVYRNLKRASSRRAYRFLDKRFFHKPTWEFDLHHFATQKLGFSSNYDTGQLKAQLRPAFAELEAIGFIQPVSYAKVARKRWNVKISRQLPITTIDSSSKTIDDPTRRLIERLVGHGVAARAAKSLVATFTSTRIEEKLAFVSWLIAKKDLRVATNPPGFLVSAIKDDYPLSADYLRHIESASKPQYRSKARTQSVIKAKNIEKRSDHDQALDSFLAGQCEATISDWLNSALAETSKFTCDSYQRLMKQGGSLFAELRITLLRDYIVRHRLLNNATSAA